MEANRLQGPRGIFPNGEIATHSLFFHKAAVRRPRWQWVARDQDKNVIVVYEVEDWSDSGENGALWQLRELAASAFHGARVYRGW
jgi:hypothetical protein